MIALARAHPADHLRVIDLPYRLCSWALDQPGNVQLWRDGSGRLLGWGVLQTPFWTLDICSVPALDGELLPEIFAWAEQRAREAQGTPYGLPVWFASAFADQSERIRLLEQAGFANQADVGEDSWSKVWMRRTAGSPLGDYPAPSGFEVRPLKGEDEAGAYVELHRAVFESKNMTLEWRQRTLRHPDHRADLDMVVAALDGRLAAFCIGWLSQDDSGKAAGQIEPLGCAKDFRRYALGRVALVETLRRLEACGAQEIYVETDNYRDTAFRLYQSLGFEVVRDVLMFRKDFPPA